MVADDVFLLVFVLRLFRFPVDGGTCAPDRPRRRVAWPFVPLRIYDSSFITDAIRLVKHDDTRIRQSALYYIAACSDRELLLVPCQELTEVFLDLGVPHEYAEDYVRFMELVRGVDWAPVVQVIRALGW